MPDWQANWVDVRFDHLAARLAIDTLWRAGRLLDDQAMGRDGAVHEVNEEWRGPRHDEWLTAYQLLRRDSDALSRRLRSGAIAIENLASEARREQRRREDARMSWLRLQVAELHLGRQRQAPIAWNPPST